MLQLLLAAAMGPFFVSADSALPPSTLPLGTLAPGMQWNYRGTLEAATAEAAKTRKTFDLTVWVTRTGEGGGQVFWIVDERGRGEFPWSEHFGQGMIDDLWRTPAVGPGLLYDRGDARSVISVVIPLFAINKPLSADLHFQEGKLEYHVERAVKVGERPAWQINVRDGFGFKRTMYVDQQSPVVLALAEKVVIGRGEEYQLKLGLLDGETLGPEQLASFTRAVESLMALRGKLNHPPQSHEAEWSADQLSVLRARLPQIVKAAATTPLDKLVGLAQRDFQVQSGRSDAVGQLSSKFDGREVDDFSAKGFNDDALTRADLQGRVTVLHFWDYRDEPLKEPYGQVGYLDFMYHRRRASGLQVYGVAVDGRLGDGKTRGEAERSVRKLKQFMNLSYPVLLDSGSLLKQFGDPRLLGANLPLFVVIGPEGKIVHYHVGHYEVNQDQGLKELDQVVVAALQSK